MFFFRRSLTKRKSCDPVQCMTFAKRARNRQTPSRNDNQQGQASHGSASCRENAGTLQAVTASCKQVNSAIRACTLSGPALQTIFNSSLVNMMTMLQAPLSPPPNTQASSSVSNLSNFITNSTFNTIFNAGFLSHARVPNLISMVRYHLSSQRPFRSQELPVPHPPTNNEHRTELFQRQIMLCGGVGVTASENDSLIRYFCRIRMRIKLDFGSSRESLVNLQLLSDFHDL